MNTYPYCFMIELPGGAPAYIYESQGKVYLWQNRWSLVGQPSLREAFKALSVTRYEKLHKSQLPAFARLGPCEESDNALQD